MSDPIDAELRELFSGAIAEAERTIDVDERYRQWIVGSSLQTGIELNATELPVAGPLTPPKKGWFSGLAIPTGIVVGFAMSAFVLFAAQAKPPQAIEGTEINLAESVTAVPQPDAIVGEESPSDPFTSTPPLQSKPDPTLTSVVPPSVPSTVSTLPTTASGSKPTATTPSPSTTNPSTTASTNPSSTNTSSTNTSSSNPSSTVTTPATTGPSTQPTGPTTAPASTLPSPRHDTSTTTTVAPPETAVPPTTEQMPEMVVRVNGRLRTGETIPGIVLSTDEWMIEREDGRYLLLQQCQFVDLTAPDGYLFETLDAPGTKPLVPGLVKTVEICPRETLPRFRTITEILILS